MNKQSEHQSSKDKNSCTSFSCSELRSWKKLDIFDFIYPEGCVLYLSWVRVYLFVTDVFVFTCAFYDHERGTFRCRTGPAPPSCRMLADLSEQTPTTPSFLTRCLTRAGSHESEPSEDVDRRVFIFDSIKRNSRAHAADIEDCLKLFMNQDEIDDSIQLVMDAAKISRARAIKALLEHGNVVDTILALSESE